MNEPQKIKVIFADDQDVYRDGLRMLLGRDKTIKLLGEAADGGQLVELAKSLHPDVVLTDLIMPGMDGIAAIKEISKLGLNIKAIAISTFDSDYLIVEALEAGALGYINKNAQKGEIIEAIKTVYENHVYYCESTSAKLMMKILKSKFNPYLKPIFDLYSEREKQIIQMVCEDKTSEEIGKILNMGVRNVESLRAKILKKMGVKTTAGWVIYAIKNGLYHIDLC